MPLVLDERLSQTEADTFAYDILVVHAIEDESFVQGYLLPELGLDPKRVLVPKELRPGRSVVSEIDRSESRSTLA